jgi:hypothetical protein
MKFVAATMLAALLLTASPALAEVKYVRVPERGLQPQAVSRDGVVHLIYLIGDPGKSDIRYSRSTDDGKTWSPPIAVNDAQSRGIAAGTVRGPHLAMGRDGMLHVAWMGSQKALFYTRLTVGAKAFEPPRNLMTTHPGLDGGSSIAADGSGHVYVAWHAPSNKPDGDEASRRLWLISSSDDGKSFSAERSIFDSPTGACACCAVRLHVSPQGNLFALYRGAREMTHRGLFLLSSTDHGETFRGTELAPMELGICLMSTASFADVSDATLVAWETKGKVFWGRIAPGEAAPAKAFTVAEGQNQKHPTLAVAPNGDVLCAWTEKTMFGKGGDVAWQVFGADGIARDRQVGGTPGLKAFNFPAAFSSRDGTFVILY